MSPPNGKKKRYELPLFCNVPNRIKGSKVFNTLGLCCIQFVFNIVFLFERCIVVITYDFLCVHTYWNQA